MNEILALKTGELIASRASESWQKKQADVHMLFCMCVEFQVKSRTT